ncbi:MAG: VCBS repeat-containing protein, partial [Ignavibacteriota bacterium]
MNRLLTLFAILFLVSFYNLQAQDIFTRTSTIHTLTYEPGGGGIGGVVAGVDWDNDGKPDLYVCNANYIDRQTGELIPKIWKFEWNEVTAEWDSVWGATLPAQAQNTWTTLVAADLDKDGKPELVWTPVNFSSPDPPAPQNPNPLRIVVYEVVGDGSDNLGVDDGFGAFLPNAATTIVTDNNYNLRPISLKVLDIDNDGTDELIFADQASDWHFGVLSVDDIPDNGSGLENWTVEASGLNDPVQTGMGSAYDVAVIGKTIYVFASSGLIYPVKYDGFAWVSSAPLTNVANEDGSFRGTATADLDNDGTDEIILGGWSSGNVFVLKQVADTLQTFVVADLSTMGATRLNGAAVGDLDEDGKPDFVFGTRPISVPNNAVYRVEFQGGDITDPANYQSQIIDSLLVPAPGGTGGQLDVVYMANVDGDAADEVLYTQG